ncbi:metallophosphoesterase [Algoriphagus sp. A40]|uniref:metallophosphoesterase family protein n=1 Tax=Algoriphagus sp. A40 TaxID=1945863 RepID=UPI0009848EBD|nr:metallophosphoesterase [Algoriphagus sp. A40]OOG74260.1 metallophosphoesterase [Algoriphagus sp. A40]
MKIISALLLSSGLLATFPLLAQKDNVVKFGLCTDVHIPTMHDSEYRMNTFIEAMKKEKPDFIIELGDFTIPKPEFQKTYDIWNSFPGEKHHVIGNHEMDGGTSHEKALEYRSMKSAYYSFDKNGFHFVVLDGNDKTDPTKKGYQQLIGKEQLEWLKQDLEKAQYPVVLFSHQGLSIYKTHQETYGVENYQEVQDLLQEHNRLHPDRKVIASFNGHTHVEYVENIGGIWYISTTSMAYHWLGEDYEQIRYSEEVDKKFRWIKYTAPFKEPLFTTVEISTNGTIKIAGKKTEWVGPSPFEMGFPENLKKYMHPGITKRNLKFNLE